MFKDGGSLKFFPVPWNNHFDDEVHIVFWRRGDQKAWYYHSKLMVNLEPPRKPHRRYSQVHRYCSGIYDPWNQLETQHYVLENKTVSTTRATPITHPSRHHKGTRCDHNMHPARWPGSGNTRQCFQLHGCQGYEVGTAWLAQCWRPRFEKKLGNSFSRSKRNRDTHKSFFILDGTRKINGLNFLLELMFFWTPTT